DRYAAGEPVVVTLHALTTPPVRIALEAALIEGEHERPLHVEGATDGCVDVTERGVRLRVTGVVPVGRARLMLKTCAPRVEKTPDTVETNVIEVRAAD